MFLQYDNEEFQKQIEDFYEIQSTWLKENNHKLKKKEYLSNLFLQEITIKYLDNPKDNENSKLFSKALDILIRHCMTSKDFINYADETKREFYSNAQYRLFNYALRTYDPIKQTAFVYFTSAINNAFIQIINEDNKERKKEKNVFQTDGLDSIIYNADKSNIHELECDYEIKGNISHKRSDLAPFIQELLNTKIGKEKKYKTKKLRVLENPGTPRFMRKFSEFKYFIPIYKDEENNEKGVIVEYIDIEKKNEDKGVHGTYYQNRNLIARRNGHQVFMLFSDVYNDENIEDEVIFKKLDTMIENMKAKSEINTGNDLMLDYIHYSMIEVIGVTETRWYALDDKRRNRLFTMKQSIEHYQELKEIDDTITRVYDCGLLKM